jgi:hypothetical protein
MCFTRVHSLCGGSWILACWRERSTALHLSLAFAWACSLECPEISSTSTSTSSRWIKPTFMYIVLDMQGTTAIRHLLQYIHTNSSTITRTTPLYHHHRLQSPFPRSPRASGPISAAGHALIPQSTNPTALQNSLHPPLPVVAPLMFFWLCC